MKLHIALAFLTLACIGASSCRADERGFVAGAEQALREKLALAYPTVTRWEIEVLPSSAATGIGTDAIPPTVTVTRVGERSAVWVGSKSLGEQRRGALLWFSVAGYAPAVTAARALTAGTSLDARDGEILEHNIVSGDCRPVDDTGALVGMRVKRMIHAGEMICASALEPAPPVTRGEEVTLRYTGRSFTLTARGVAQADGILGKRVMVRNVSSGDVFAATVTGRGEVSVDE
jgi:flagella basal body P-ring formation protein FlgA